VSSVPSRDVSPTVYIQTKERKEKQKRQSVPCTPNNPGGWSNIPLNRTIRKTHSDWCSRVDVALNVTLEAGYLQNRHYHLFYLGLDVAEF
jgi:hypothetical protein